MALLRETLAHRIHPPLRQTKQSPRWAGHKPAFPILCRLVPHPPADPLTKAEQVLRPTVPRHTSFPSDIFPPTTHHLALQFRPQACSVGAAPNVPDPHTGVTLVLSPRPSSFCVASPVMWPYVHRPGNGGFSQPPGALLP